MRDDERKDQVVMQITTGTIVRTVLILFLCWLLFYLRQIVLVVLSAVVFASAIEPGVKWFAQHRVPRGLGALIIYVIIFLSLGGFIYFVLPTFFKEVALFFNHLPSYLDSLQNVSEEFSFASFDLRERLLGGANPGTFSSISTFLTTIGGGFFQSASFLFGSVLDAVLIVVLSFYLSVQEKGVENFLRLIAHEKYEPYIIDLWTRSQHKIGLWMQGQLILGFLMGLFVYLGLIILGVKYQLLLAIVTLVFELIPMIGLFLATFLAIVVAFTQSVTLGIATIIFYVVLHQLESHLIYPLVVRKIVGVPPMLVILSLIVGGELAGFLGILLAVPLAAVLFEFMTDLERRKRRVPNLS
jgi:predicted PurR-regulated permease PerM